MAKMQSYFGLGGRGGRDKVQSDEPAAPSDWQVDPLAPGAGPSVPTVAPTIDPGQVTLPPPGTWTVEPLDPEAPPSVPPPPMPGADITPTPTPDQISPTAIPGTFTPPGAAPAALAPFRTANYQPDTGRGRIGPGTPGGGNIDEIIRRLREQMTGGK